MSKRKKSLALLITQETAIVIAAAMAVYAVFQYFWTPGKTLWGLLVEHGWHVLVLGCLTYLVLNVILFKKVVRPIRDLYMKFYAIGKGDFGPVSLNSNLYEIQAIVDGVNLMVAKMDASARRVSLPDLSSAAQEIRSAVRQSEGLELPLRERLIGVAEKIEEAAAALASTSVKEEKEG